MDDGQGTSRATRKSKRIEERDKTPPPPPVREEDKWWGEFFTPPSSPAKRSLPALPTPGPSKRPRLNDSPVASGPLLPIVNSTRTRRVQTSKSAQTSKTAAKEVVIVDDDSDEGDYFEIVEPPSKMDLEQTTDLEEMHRANRIMAAGEEERMKEGATLDKVDLAEPSDDGGMEEIPVDRPAMHEADPIETAEEKKMKGGATFVKTMSRLDGAIADGFAERDQRRTSEGEREGPSKAEKGKEREHVAGETDRERARKRVLEHPVVVKEMQEFERRRRMRLEEIDKTGGAMTKAVRDANREVDNSAKRLRVAMARLAFS